MSVHVGDGHEQDYYDGVAMRELRSIIPRGYALRMDASRFSGSFVGFTIIDPATGKEASFGDDGEWWWTGETVEEAANAMTAWLRSMGFGGPNEADTRTQSPGTRPV